MARITVPFSGLTSHPNHKDGECSNLVNLRPKNGYLKPVPPRKTIDTLDKEYDIVFVHRVSGNNTNWIGVIGSVIYSDINSTAPKLLNDVGESINSVQQVGNTLSFVCDTNIYYTLWSDNAYKWLGSLPELPAMSIKSSKNTVWKFFREEYTGQIPKSGEALEHFQGLINVAMDIFANGGKNGDGEIREPCVSFHDAHLLRYAFKLYDGSVIKHSSPILIMPPFDIKELKLAQVFFNDNNDFDLNYSSVRINGYDLKATINTSHLESWKDIIKSIDIYISPSLGLSNVNNIDENDIVDVIAGKRKNINIGGYFYSNLLDDIPNDVIEHINSESRFFMIQSIDVGDTYTTSNPLTIPKDDSLVKRDDSLVMEERLPLDSFSHHSIGAKSSTVYNNRLRLSGITTTLYDGHPLEQFKWDSNYNGEPKDTTVHSDVYVRVFIKTDEGQMVVQRELESTDVFLNSFISYPDPRAYKISVEKIKYQPEGMFSYLIAEIVSIKLQKHPQLNIAYAINNDLKPFVGKSSIIWRPLFSNALNSYSWGLYEPNKLKVSEVNNPFMFPNQNTYQIGSGEILAESSIVMNVTDRNYGMYPVFVFTDNGVFTMAGQTADTVHDSVQAPTYLEPPISDKICATPYGVVFITKRGLMIISQHETKSLSPQLREDGDNVIFRMPGTDDDPVVDLHDKIYPADSITFRDFLSTVSDMIYNPYNDELIISSKENEYCYVYDFPTSSYYISTENITGVVQNSFPDIYVLDGKSVKDYSQKHNGTTNISIITRPLHFGTSDIKTLERSILRALLYKVHSITVIAFHSVDGVRFEPAKGRLVMGDDKNYKDIDLGLLARETYPHYVLLISGTIDDESQIKYAEFEVSKRYDNDKMR